MTMISGFSVSVAYTQILVHIAGHPQPGLLWTQDHVAQGFAWADGIVSFAIPDHDGECLVQITQGVSVEPEASAIWAIQVPFQVTEPLMIGTVFDMRPVTIPQGQYDLIFEALPGRDDFAYVFNLKFKDSQTPGFAILKQGGEPSAQTVLRKDAQPAG